MRILSAPLYFSLTERFMIPLIQLSHRPFKSSNLHTHVGPLAAALVLALIICFQIALLVLVFINK
jgi:hypothetical protein